MHHLLHEESSHNLELLAFDLTDIGGYDHELKELFDSGFTHATVPMNALVNYCAGDVDATWRIRERLLEELEQDSDREHLRRWYRDVVMPTCHSLSRMEDVGMQLSSQRLLDLRIELEIEREVLQRQIEADPATQRAKLRLKLGSRSFNPKSPHHVKSLLFDVLGLEPAKLTKTGTASTADLDKIDSDLPLVLVLNRIRSTLYDLQELRDLEAALRPDGRVNTDFYQAGVVTWRMSSRSPNLQNLPRNGRVKREFVSRFQGGQIVQGDFSQLEVRLVGALSGEEKYAHAFRLGYDFHRYTASLIFDRQMDAVTDDERNIGKRTNFGIIFGIGAKKMAAETGLSPLRVARILEKYFETYSRVDTWMKEARRTATRRLRVVSVLGAVRRVPNARHPDKMERWRAQRQAANFLIGQTGAGITELCMNEIAAEFRDRDMRAIVINQVHDSIVIDSPADEVQTVGRIMHRVMTDGTWSKFSDIWLNIPLLADVAYGPSYGEAKTVIPRPTGAVKSKKHA